MKLKIMAIAATLMASLSINKTNAQTAPFATANYNHATINTKIQARFQKAFPDAGHTTWKAIKNGYEANFSDKGIETIVRYNKAGRLNYVVEHYNADQLPSAIKTQINDAYKEYDIVNAIGVRSANEAGYLVNIQSKKFKKVIRINDDGMDVYQDMTISN
jgi:hypothetical protein